MVFSLKKTQNEVATRPEEKLFTQTAAPELAATAREIKGAHARFTTDYMGLAEEGQKAVRDERLVAWQMPGSVLFRIDKISRFLPPGETTPWIKKEDFIAGGICFFDALHLLSNHQAGGEEQGLTAFPAEDADAVHWRIAAKEAGQALDARGIVQPCADKRVLTSGVYFKNEEELRVAEHSAPSFNAAALKPGERMKDESVFLGFYDPDQDQISSVLDEKHPIALFSAPTDVKKKNGSDDLELTFNKMAEHVAALSDWHGHNGAGIKKSFFSSYEKNLKKHLLALKEGGSTGWFIGTKEMLLQRNRTERYLNSWSCTQDPNDSGRVLAAQWSHTVSFLPDYIAFPARPVRAERFKP